MKDLDIEAYNNDGEGETRQDDDIQVDDKNDNERFTSKGLRDPVFLFLFLVHCGGLIALMVSGLSDSKIETISVSDFSFDLGIIPASAVISCIAGMIFLWIMKKNAENMIKICFGIYCCIIGGLSLLCFTLKGGAALGVILLFVLLITCLYLYCVRRRIAFAAETMKISMQALNQFSGPFGVSVLCCVLVLMWLVVCVLTIAGASRDETWKVWVTLFSLFWTSQVCSNISHVTTSGVIGTWYFKKDASSASMPALKRAVTTSLGSICFGSLIVAILKLLKALAENADNGIGACLVQCLENIAKYINKYAYVYVAIYGMSFGNGAKQVWNLIKSGKIITALINDDLSGTVLLMGVWVGAGVGAGVGALYHMVMDSPGDSINYIFVGLLTGFVINVILMKVVESSVSTIYVCFAEDPNALERNHPKVSKRLEAAAARIYPGYRIH